MKRKKASTVIAQDIREQFQNMTLWDDRFFASVVHDQVELSQHLINDIFKAARITQVVVKSAKAQQLINNLDKHSIILDLLAKDVDGNTIDIEVQNVAGPDIVQRANYYAASMVVKSLASGQSYAELPKSIVVFITRHDFYGEGRAVYVASPRLHHNNKSFGETITFIVVNGEYQGRLAISKILRDMSCTKVEDMCVDYLRERVKSVKQSEKIMKEWNDFIKEREAKAVKEAVEKAFIKHNSRLLRLFVRNKVPLADIAEYLGTDEKTIRPEYERICKLMNA